MTREKAFEIIANLNEEIMELKNNINELKEDNKFWSDMATKYRTQVDELSKNYILTPINTTENKSEIPKPINI